MENKIIVILIEGKELKIRNIVERKGKIEIYSKILIEKVKG